MGPGGASVIGNATTTSAVMAGQCKDGAIGAAVAEMMAQLMPPKNGIAYSDSEKANVLAVSKLVAGAASAYAGGNAQTAINTAETAVQNNALVLPEGLSIDDLQ